MVSYNLDNLSDCGAELEKRFNEFFHQVIRVFNYAVCSEIFLNCTAVNSDSYHAYT